MQTTLKSCTKSQKTVERLFWRHTFMFMFGCLHGLLYMYVQSICDYLLKEFNVLVEHGKITDFREGGGKRAA